MNFEEALTKELESIPSLAGKVFPMSTPGKSAPYAQYQSSFGQQDKALGGYLDSKGVDAEVNLFAKSYREIKGLEEATVGLLVGFEERNIGVDGPFIAELTYDEPVEMYEEAPKLYRCVISFRVNF